MIKAITNKIYYICGKEYCCRGDVNEAGVIVFTAPYLKSFLNQPFENLKNWRRTTEVKEIKER